MMRKFIAVIMLSTLISPPVMARAATPKALSFQAEVWVDNWFALYVNGKKIGEDSEPITTERSFNSSKIKFTATYPFTFGIMAKDYTENASGLEYIGTDRQQIGDGGIIAQIREIASGKVVASTAKDWKVLVANKAPVNQDCVKSKNPTTECKYVNTLIPNGWAKNSYKDATWKSATEYSKEEVGVKEGYFDFTWTSGSSLIWSSDLKLDNTVLLRKVVTSKVSNSAITSNLTLTSPNFVNNGNLPKDFTCDGSGISPSFKWSNVPSNAQSLMLMMDTVPGPLRPGEVDIGNHYYLNLFNIPVTTNSISSSATNIGTLGKNFQGKLGYTPPCSQGPGSKIYNIYLFALSEKLTINSSEATGALLLKAIEGKVISSTKMSVNYTRT